MTSAFLFALGVAAQLVVLVSALVVTIRERLGLSSFVTAMARWADKEAGERQDVVRLPAECHGAATRLTEGLQAPAGIEEAVLDALSEIADSRIGPPIAIAIATDVALVLLALGPMVVGLLDGAVALADLWAASSVWAASSAKASPALYARELALVPALFDGVRSAFAHSAGLLVSLPAVLALRWWLLRPEARIARMLRAILSAAIAARPGASAPTAARLANRISPMPGLRPGVRAAAAFCVMFTVAWALLVGTADLRAENTVAPRFDEWPARRIGAKATVMSAMPSYPAGQPSFENMGASLIVDKSDAQLAQQTTATLSDGRFTDAAWRTRVDEMAEALDRYRDDDGNVDVVVLAHKELPASTIVSLISHLAKTHRAKHFHLVIERTVTAAGRPGTTTVQAALSVVLDTPPAMDTAIQLDITPQGVRVDRRGGEGPQQIAFADPSLFTKVSKAVRSATRLGEAKADPRVVIGTSDGVSYDQLVAVLSAADTTCDGRVECGLPGFGLELRLR